MTTVIYQFEAYVMDTTTLYKVWAHLGYIIFFKCSLSNLIKHIRTALYTLDIYLVRVCL